MNPAISEILRANQSFYDAFSSANLVKMRAIWADTAEVVCIHPGWSPLTGIDEVMSSWDTIFRAQRALRLARLVKKSESLAQWHLLYAGRVSTVSKRPWLRRISFTSQNMAGSSFITMLRQCLAKMHTMRSPQTKTIPMSLIPVTPFYTEASYIRRQALHP